jgi:hypothetical protein
MRPAGTLKELIMTKTTTTLHTPCFYIEDGEVREGVLGDFDNLIETATRPTGVGYKYYVTTIHRRVDAVYDDEGNEIEPERIEEVWALAKWATWNGPEIVVQEFDSEEEANAAAEQTYVHDILGNSEVCVYLDRESAEAELKDLNEIL